MEGEEEMERFRLLSEEEERLLARLGQHGGGGRPSAFDPERAAAEAYAIGRMERAGTATDRQREYREDLVRRAREERLARQDASLDEAAQAYLLRQGGYAAEAEPHAQRAERERDRVHQERQGANWLTSAGKAALAGLVQPAGAAVRQKGERERRMRRAERDSFDQQQDTVLDELAQAYLLRQGGYAAEAEPYVQRAEEVQTQAHQERQVANRLRNARAAAEAQRELEGLQAARRNSDYEELTAQGKSLDSEPLFTRGAVKNPVEFAHRNPGAFAFVDNGAGGVPITYNDGAQAKYRQLSDQERKDYNYYLGKGDRASADRYLELLDRSLNRREGEELAEQVKEDAREHPVSGAAQSVLAGGVLGPLAVLPIVGQGLKNAVTGEYESVDPYNPFFSGAIAKNAGREGLTEGRPAWQQMLINGALDMGESLTHAPAGALAPALDIAQAAGESGWRAAANGGTADEALLAATAGGASEWLAGKLLPTGETEPGLVGDLQKVAADRKRAALSGAVDSAAETALLGSRSSYARYRDALIDQGLSPEEAEWQALRTFFVTRPQGFDSDFVSGAKQPFAPLPVLPTLRR